MGDAWSTGGEVVGVLGVALNVLNGLSGVVRVLWVGAAVVLLRRCSAFMMCVLLKIYDFC